jgi:membrane fusion protein (multidrug efflux system)
MTKKTLLFLAGLVGCLLLIAGPLTFLKLRQFKAMGDAGAAMAAMMPPTTVTAAPVMSGTWGESLSAPGSLEAVQGVTVAAETPGKVVKIAFEPGSAVQAGDLLVQLDTTTLARANLERAKELWERNAIAKSEFDAAEAQAKQGLAQADGIRTVIAKKTIRAPFAGRLGLRLVNLGQILREGDNITTLQTLDPIYVNFSLPQQQLAQLARGTAVRITSDATPGQIFTGQINAVSPEVDVATRNIRVQATIANAAETLRPGMYATVEVVLPTQASVLTIPVTAILYAPYGDSVFVIDQQKDEKSGKTTQVLRQQFIRIGGARGDFINVVDGLKAGDLVVTSGVFKLRPGTSVVVDNTLAPNAQLEPKPKNT